MTYYGYEMVFRFTFSCGCVREVGPILEKFAYQYGGLGAQQRCKKRGAPEVDRLVRRHGAPRARLVETVERGKDLPDLGAGLAVGAPL
jgi:hypothetical protein